MVEHYYTEDVSERDFPYHEQPELALVKLRAEVEGRLRFLEHYLAPEHEGSGRPGSALVEKELLSKDTYSVISEVVDAAASAIHARRIEPGSAGVLVDTGLRIMAILDGLIAVVLEKLRNLKPDTQLLYRFMELSTLRRNSIAQAIGAEIRSRGRESRLEQAREVLKVAKAKGIEDELRSLVRSGMRGSDPGRDLLGG